VKIPATPMCLPRSAALYSWRTASFFGSGHVVSCVHWPSYTKFVCNGFMLCQIAKKNYYEI